MIFHVRLVNGLGVVNDTEHADRVGNRILCCTVRTVAVVILIVAVLLLDVLIIGNLRKIKLLDAILLDQTGNHVVRGDNQIVMHRTAGEFCIHLFVGGIGGVLNVDLVFFFKNPLQVHRAILAVGDIFAPVVNIQCGSCVGGFHILNILVGIGAGGEGDQNAGAEQQRQGKRKCFFHFLCPLCLIK